MSGSLSSDKIPTTNQDKLMDSRFLSHHKPNILPPYASYIVSFWTVFDVIQQHDTHSTHVSYDEPTKVSFYSTHPFPLNMENHDLIANNDGESPKQSSHSSMIYALAQSFCYGENTQPKQDHVLIPPNIMY
jgi:hypothetical protein